MRNLSLDEKISIKGRLVTKGVLPAILARLTMANAVPLYWHCFGTPVAYHATPKMWRKVLPRFKRITTAAQMRSQGIGGIDD